MARIKKILCRIAFVSVGAVAVFLSACLDGGDGIDDSFNPDMAFVAGGAFAMGCTAEQGSDCGDNELPARTVAVGGFYVGVAPVTQFQWVRLMGTTIIEWSASSVGDNFPIYGVSWNEANQYIRKLNGRTGKKYRLLTEAEWEYAARGGLGSGGYKYAGSDNISEVAWYSGNSGNRVREVCKKSVNELGLCDMSGNVREWVSDAFGVYGDASAGDGASDRVFRGGSWATGAAACRVSARAGASSGNRNQYIGFRLALSP